MVIVDDCQLLHNRIACGYFRDRQYGISLADIVQVTYKCEAPWWMTKEFIVNLIIVSLSIC